MVSLLHLGVLFLLLSGGYGDENAVGASAKKETAIVVEASYPGANCRVVAEAVAGPIEIALAGASDMQSMRSRSTNGGYSLTATFRAGADPDKALALVKKRVEFAQAMLPPGLRNSDAITVKRTPGELLLFVATASPTRRFDGLYLSNFITGNVKEELARLPGIGAATGFGLKELQVRVWLDTDRLRRFDLVTADVARTLERNKPKLGAAELRDLEKIENLVLRTFPGGQVVRLRDVARIELGAAAGSDADLDGHSAVLLGLRLRPDARPKTVSTAVRAWLAKQRAKLPDGLDMHVVFDFSGCLEDAGNPAGSEYLLLDIVTPAGASKARVATVLNRWQQALAKVSGVQHVLSLSDHPFDKDGQPCLLIQLEPPARRQKTRAEVIEAIRARFKDFPVVLTRLRDLSRPGALPRGGYPLEFAVHGPDAKKVRRLAERLVESLNADDRFTDLAMDPRFALQPQFDVQIDRAAATKLGLQVADILHVLEMSVDTSNASGLSLFGGTWKLSIQPDRASDPADLARLAVRGADAKLVPLGRFAKISSILAPVVIERLNGQPMLEISANPAARVSIPEAVALCRQEFERSRQQLQLARDYRLSQLGAGAAK